MVVFTSVIVTAKESKSSLTADYVRLETTTVVAASYDILICV